MITTAQNIRTGLIRNHSVAYESGGSVCGFGRLGTGKHNSRDNGEISIAYSRWAGMINRCYNKGIDSYKSYGAKGVTVCDEWRDFQAFAKWFYQNYRHGLELDKDIKVDGNKVYGPETCVFASREENQSAIKRGESFIIKSPIGDLIEGVNLSKFCADNGLDCGNMSKVLRGIRLQHKGWSTASE